MNGDAAVEGELSTFVHFLRSSAPYIHAHRGRTFVIAFGGEAVQSSGFATLMQDVALLHGLGVRVVLVHGARPQIDVHLAALKLETRFVDAARGDGQRRVTDKRALQGVQQAVSAVRAEIEATLSMGASTSPMEGARLRVAAGNFVVAQPVGVVDGVDYQYTGDVRRVDVEAVRQRLDAGAVVVISPLGYSVTGEIFNVAFHDVASAVAAGLGADKLVALVEGRVLSKSKRRVDVLTPAEAEAWLARAGGGAGRGDLRAHMAAGVIACRGGVRRVHLVPRREEGGLLKELYTRDGIGTMVTSEGWAQVRRARLADAVGVLALIEPLAEQGLLLRRPRELVETQIDRFAVIEHDGMVVACAALFPYPDRAAGEVAAVAVDARYRDRGNGDDLLRYVERWARQEGIVRLFALTTRAAHWFRERGFSTARVVDLPAARKKSWSRKRNSKVLVKTLD